MERAFDSVWHAGLIYKFQHAFPFPSNLTTLLKNYLHGRTFQVRVHSTLSLSKVVRAGVPQGTVLAPTLYSLYTADLPTSDTVTTLLYADDIILYSGSFYAQVAGRRLRLLLHDVTNYMTDWKLRINPTKTNLVVFTKKFTNITIFEPIKIKDVTIQETTRTKYLGLTLDKRLFFKPHVSSIISKTVLTLQKLYPLLAKNNKLSIQNKLLIYKTVLRPSLTYACPVWQSASTTQRHRLQTLQNKLLRLATNSNRYADMTQLHNAHNILPINDFITETSQKFFTHTIHNSPLTTHIADIRHGHDLITAHKLIHQGLPIYFN